MKIYLALNFESRPDIHLTLAYFGEKKTVDEVKASVDTLLDELRNDYGVQPFTLESDIQKMYGPHNNVKAIKFDLKDMPYWVEYLAQKMRTDTKYSFSPHVTTDEPSLELVANAITIMHKKEVLHEWRL